MISRIAIFGDSYMDGSELPCSDPDLRHMFDALFTGVQRHPTGAIPENLRKPSFYDDFNRLTFSIPDYFDRCHAYSMGGYLARKLGIPFENHAFGGYSNDAIMAEIWNHRGSLDADTLVLIGLTFPTRTTRLDGVGHGGHIMTFNSHSIEVDGGDHERFLELSMRYGDDTLTSVLRVCNHVCAIGTLLRGIPHVIIDPLNIYRQNPEIDGKVFPWPKTRLIENMVTSMGEAIMIPYLVSQFQDFLDRSTCRFTLNHAMIDLALDNIPYNEALGHPNRMAHETYVDRYLHPYLVMEGMIQ